VKRLRILLVEDDLMLGEAARDGLLQDGFAVDWVTTGAAALAAARTVDYAAILLDLGLPVMNGLEVLATLRRESIPTPILIVTARDQIQDRITGLNKGADDYVIKPFDLDELAARIRAVVRRANGRASTTLHADDIEIDTAAKRVKQHGLNVELTAREYAILVYLLERLNRIVSKSQLQDAIYDWSSDVESNTIEVYVHQLRRKFGAETIKTVRGMGYIVESSV
jgi:two-component system, OmpR family, response regulator QseB